MMDVAIRTTEVLTGLALCLQTVEFLALWKKGQSYLIHLLLRLAAAIAVILWGSSLGLSLLLFVSMVVLLIRWRGAFNGGSDFMTLVLLTGLVIANGFDWKAGLFYIAIQAGTSYFVSGAIKLLNPDWRSGKALPLFLDAGIYGPLAPDSLHRRPAFAMIVSWIFILWEISVVIALLDPRLMLAFCAAGLVFHFLVFWYLGLNRFFFAWIATYPALFYLSTAISA